MSVVLFGAAGQLGEALVKASPTTLKAFDRNDVELTNLDHIRAALNDTKPTIILNAAAYTNVDLAENEPQIANAVNHLAVSCMAEEALRHNALLVTYSTDYVFNGEKLSPYSETDVTDALNMYGTSKISGEQAVMSSGCRHLILRTSWLYSERQACFVGKILAAAKNKAELHVVSDQIGSPTHVTDLAQATYKMLEKADKYGLYHCAASGAISRSDWAKEIIREAGLSTRIIPITTQETISTARRPLNSQLSCQKLADDYGVIMPCWND